MERKWVEIDLKWWGSLKKYDKLVVIKLMKIWVSFRFLLSKSFEYSS